MVEAALQVLMTGELPLGLNHTLITLISKTKQAVKVFYFLPIILCNVLYNLIFKVIANRLKLIFPYIIFESQITFMPRRHISNNVLISYELIQFFGKKE